MYDRHKSIIKWYEYDATKLVKKADEDTNAASANEPVQAVTSAPTAPEPAPAATSATGNAELDAEVARVMAQFTSAKQDGVDSVFAAMGS